MSQLPKINFEQELVQLAYLDSIVIAADSFMKASESSYSIEFCTRELTQNWIDGGDGDQVGHLNDVELEIVPNDDSATKTIWITAPWIISNMTGLVSLQSDKNSSHSGGNGMGLLQVLVLFLRKYKVKSFMIGSNGWLLTYTIVSASKTKERLEKLGYTDTSIKNNWLIATKSDMPSENECAYGIETDSKIVLDSFDDFFNLGVGNKNKYLGAPDFSSSMGSLKFLNEPNGMLYINGQIYQAEKNENFPFGTSGFVTLNLTYDYKKTLDRSELSKWELASVIGKLLTNCSKETLYMLLQKSKHIWKDQKANKGDYSKDYSFLVIQEICYALKKKTNKKEFVSLFGDKFATASRETDNQDIIKAKKKDYIACPIYFEELGLPKIEDVIEDVEEIKNEKPVFSKSSLNKVAETGTVIGFNHISPKSQDEFTKYLFSALKYDEISVSEDSLCYKFIYNSSDIFTHNLSIKPLINPKDEIQNKLINIRSCFFYGLDIKAIKSISTIIDKTIYTYGIVNEFDEHLLLCKKTELKNTKSSDKTILEINFSQKPIIDLNDKDITIEMSLEENILKEEDISDMETIELDNTVYEEFTVTTASKHTKDLAVLHKKIKETLKNTESKDNDEVSKEFNKFDLRTMSLDINSINKKNQIDDIDNVTKTYTENEQHLIKISNSIVNSLSKDEITNFKICKKNELPTKIQKKLFLLTKFLNIVFKSQNINLTDSIFVFTGNGTSGVSINGTVGLHRKLFNSSFYKALTVAVHEIVHLNIKDHDSEFINTLENLLGHTVEQLVSIQYEDDVSIDNLELLQIPYAFENAIVNTKDFLEYQK